MGRGDERCGEDYSGWQGSWGPVLGRGLNADTVDKAEKQERELLGEAGCVEAGSGDGTAFEEPRRVGWDVMRVRS